MAAVLLAGLQTLERFIFKQKHSAGRNFGQDQGGWRRAQQKLRSRRPSPVMAEIHPALRVG
ncbi:hypothetical protein AC244_08605 [Ensifer adhaerens]|uniref:Uncharacterized protein n=1 Tax=Ensifer adhaerens TaxID=106592 RepID=A0A0L8C3L1_ENSAD|nr:hypothetical protein AC244_08605 [Ensifer adhaerens]